MPKKLAIPGTTSTLVQERLATWGRSILAERLRQRVTVADLCHRISISDATLRRLERGDPGAAAGTYLAALMVLGLLDQAVPSLSQAYPATPGRRRVRPSSEERRHDDDYF
jgi:transcriptional regulator with XRE-family HTH domain